IVLRRIGAQIIAQPHDGQEALDLLRRVHPDLILTDCQMPRLDGIALVKRLRERGDYTPIIMLSGQSDPDTRQLALDAGVNRYLSKPRSEERRVGKDRR